MYYIDIMKKRRSYYAIKSSSKITKQKILTIIESALKYTPSPFNCQSQMVAVLFGEEHQKLWAITLEALKKIVPTENFAKTQAKIQSFAEGNGTILFFNDDSMISASQKSFPLYKDSFPVWAEQANGMLQINIWNMLESEGLGVNLQHYNPLIDLQVKAIYNIAESWRLIAQMPFGDIALFPEEKRFDNVKSRIKIFGGGANSTQKQESKKATEQNQADAPHIACSPEFHDCVDSNTIED